MPNRICAKVVSSVHWIMNGGGGGTMHSNFYTDPVGIWKKSSKVIVDGEILWRFIENLLGVDAIHADNCPFLSTYHWTLKIVLFSVLVLVLLAIVQYMITALCHGT